MAKTFKNEQELRRHLLTKCQPAVKAAQERIHHILNMFLSDFYRDYTPDPDYGYDRTYQLLQSLVKSDVKISGNKVIAEVYFDYNSLNYDTGRKPHGKRVVDAAASGGHGATGLRVVEGNTGADIWNTPMMTMDTEAKRALKEMLIREGIPIK